MAATDTHPGARCAAGCGRALGPGRCFCVPCLALMSCEPPLSRPARTPRWWAPGAMVNGHPEEVTRVAYA